MFSIATFEIVGWILRLVMVPVVLHYRRTPAAAIAWLLLIFFEPYIGSVIYLLFGRNSTLRGERVSDSVPPEKAVDPGVSKRLDTEELGLTRSAYRVSGFPALERNYVEYESDAERFIDRLSAEIDASSSHVYLLFYIFWPDAAGNKIVDAIIRARSRGVECKVIVDAMGSRRFFKGSPSTADRLRLAGVKVAAALPLIGLLRRLLVRKDFRNHRKIAIIDSQIAWVGSQNLVGPEYLGKRGGPWRDLMARFTGPIIEQYETIFLEDWAYEEGHDKPVVSARTERALLKLPIKAAVHERTNHNTIQNSEAKSNLMLPIGGVETIAQAIATGPQSRMGSYRNIIIGAANAAQKELILTSPYFSPDEPTLVALLLAAERGVKVKLIVPARSDSRLADLAGRGFYRVLVKGGCEVYYHSDGLLHAKTATMDRRIGLVGSANLDVRSFKLNFEVGGLIFHDKAVAQLCSIQESYLEHSRPLTLEELDRHPRISRFLEEVVLLLSPLL